MPAGVAVFVKCLANNRSGDIGVPVDVKIRARRVECGRKISWRCNVNGLSCRWISRTDSIELKVPGDTTLVNNVPSFYTNIAVEINFDMYVGFNVDAAGDVAGRVNCNVSLGRSRPVFGYSAAQRRDNSD